jgi:hypothetical protein
VMLVDLVSLWSSQVGVSKGEQASVRSWLVQRRDGGHELMACVVPMSQQVWVVGLGGARLGQAGARDQAGTCKSGLLWGRILREGEMRQKDTVVAGHRGESVGRHERRSAGWSEGTVDGDGSWSTKVLGGVVTQPDEGCGQGCCVTSD